MLSYQIAVKHVTLAVGVVGAGFPRPLFASYRSTGWGTPPLPVWRQLGIRRFSQRSQIRDSSLRFAPFRM